MAHFLSVSFAQGPVYPPFSWVSTITFANGNSVAEVFDFCADPAGNSYVYGYFDGSINFGNGVFLQTQLAAEGYFVAKYRPDGTLSWTRKIVASNNGIIYPEANPGGISADGNGNVYISGQFSTAALNFGGLVLQRSCAGITCSDLFVAKYNAAGQVEWARQASGSAGTFQKATRLVTGTDGTVFIAGNYEGQRLIFDDLLTYAGLNNDGMYLAHYSADGTALSASFFNNGNSYAQVEHLAITPQNEPLITGSYGDEGLDFGNGVSLGLFGDGDNNYFIARYNAQGELLRALNLHSGSYLDVLDIAADTAGQPYVVVDFINNLISGADLVTSTPAGGDTSGVLLHLVDSTFSPVLTVQYSGPTYPLGNVTVDQKNRFFVSGYFSDAQLAVAGETLTNQGCDDALLLSGSEDTVQWVRSAGGVGCEAILSQYVGRTLATDYAGHLYTVGSFGDIMQLDGFIKTGDGLFIAQLGTGMVAAHEPAVANLDFQVWPNPGSGDFKIETDEQSTALHLMVYDAQGRLCYQNPIRQAADREVHLSLPGGLYTVVLIGKNKIGRQKLLIINNF